MPQLEPPVNEFANCSLQPQCSILKTQNLPPEQVLTRSCPRLKIIGLNNSGCAMISRLIDLTYLGIKFICCYSNKSTVYRKFDQSRNDLFNDIILVSEDELNDDTILEMIVSDINFIWVVADPHENIDYKFLDKLHDYAKKNNILLVGIPLINTNRWLELRGLGYFYRNEFPDYFDVILIYCRNMLPNIYQVINGIFHIYNSRNSVELLLRSTIEIFCQNGHIEILANVDLSDLMCFCKQSRYVFIASSSAGGNLRCEIAIKEAMLSVSKYKWNFKHFKRLMYIVRSTNLKAQDIEDVGNIIYRDIDCRMKDITAGWVEDSNLSDKLEVVILIG